MKESSKYKENRRSTSGIGIAHVYAAEGAKVIVCGRRVWKGQAVDPSSIECLVHDTAEKYGKIDILVNNAANGGSAMSAATVYDRG